MTERELHEKLQEYIPMPPYEHGFENRNIILETSLLLEKAVSGVLANIFGHPDYKSSISFGNKSSAISFNQKINLLIDIGALEKDNKKKFLTFMEIRNVFMHVFEANTFTNCFGFLDNKEKFLLKIYADPKDEISEDKLKELCIALSNDIIILTLNIIVKIV